MEMHDRLGLTIKRAEQVLIRAKTRALEPVGLTVPQYAALLSLGEEPGLSGAELARRCLVTPQTMTTVLKNLEAKALVERRPHPSIGHVHQTFLTRSGRRLLHRADQAAVAVEQQLVDALPTADRAQLASLLERCIDALTPR
jgi:DNA-binding MarR family transcriptional regulator